MTFKNIEFIPYGKKAKSVEINVKDNNNKTIEFFKVFKQKQNSGDFEPRKVGSILKNKYDFDFAPNKIENNIQERDNDF